MLQNVDILTVKNDEYVDLLMQSVCSDGDEDQDIESKMYKVISKYPKMKILLQQSLVSCGCTLYYMNSET